MKSLFIFILLTLNYKSQNLIYNGGFEIYKECPVEIREIGFEKTTGWKNPNLGTYDYFNSCCKNKDYSIPINYQGISPTHSGNAYCGIGYFFKDKHIEYIETPLVKKTEIGKSYCLEFFVKKPMSYRFSFDELSVLFSKEEIKTNNAIFFSKEIIDSNVFISFKIPPHKKDEWVRISLIYKPKSEGQFLTIGFNQPESLAKLHPQSKTIGSYYYIDDISLLEIKDSSECKCNTINLEKKVSVKMDTIKKTGRYDEAITKSIVLKNINFEANKSKLLQSSYKELDELVNYLKKNPIFKIEINGYTDNTGKENDNIILSQERAKAVVNYLIQNGIDKNRTTYKGYGSQNPLTQNDSEEHKAKNRRVEFKLKTQ